MDLYRAAAPTADPLMLPHEGYTWQRTEAEYRTASRSSLAWNWGTCGCSVSEAFITRAAIICGCEEDVLTPTQLTYHSSLLPCRDLRPKGWYLQDPKLPITTFAGECRKSPLGVCL